MAEQEFLINKIHSLEIAQITPSEYPVCEVCRCGSVCDDLVFFWSLETDIRRGRHVNTGNVQILGCN